MVDPINHPPGRRRRRQFVRKVRGDEVAGSMCSRTSKRVTTSNFSLFVIGIPFSFPFSFSSATRPSSVVLRYWNVPLRRCESTAGSVRAWSLAIWIRVGDGSIAMIEAARVAFVVVVDGESGIVRASDSAKIPPPQPTSRYFRSVASLVLVVVEVVVEPSNSVSRCAG